MNDSSKSELKNIIKEKIYPLAEEAAKAENELRKLKGAAISEEVNLEKEVEDTSNFITNQLSKIAEVFGKAAELLKEELKLLPTYERERIEKECSEAGEVFVSGKRSQGKEIEFDDSLQCIIGLSEATISWIYKIGYTYFEGKHFQNAYAIFKFLTVINACVPDYWIALGLTQRHLKLDEEALFSFSFAAYIVPDHPIPRYHNAELYYEMNRLDDAKIELKVLEKIIKDKNLQNLQNVFIPLKNKINKS